MRAFALLYAVNLSTGKMTKRNIVPLGSNLDQPPKCERLKNIPSINIPSDKEWPKEISRICDFCTVLAMYVLVVSHGNIVHKNSLIN